MSIYIYLRLSVHSLYLLDLHIKVATCFICILHTVIKYAATRQFALRKSVYSSIIQPKVNK